MGLSFGQDTKLNCLVIGLPRSHSFYVEMFSHIVMISILKLVTLSHLNVSVPQRQRNINIQLLSFFIYFYFIFF